ncbi:MAG: valine--tRNA ligase [Rickettsiales bacterium]|nr:valine--tRNA ligase [Rickettsiales bacterium]
MKPLPKSYDHKEAEKRWQEYWVANGTYHFRDDLPREQTFVIDTPPPTVSGLLHMGHIFSYTQADFIARYKRMIGKDVFYPMGFDDNGLPTERLVEKIKNVRGSAMPRADFVALCKDVVVDAENEFRHLFKSTALSVDWRKEYQTINDDVRALSQASFIDLLKKDQAYRDFRPTYWDWVDQTAIAQAEIENKELPGTMNDLAFTLEDGSPLVIMTTRPELLGACVAVMYHPEDPNAAKYKGKHAVTPLFGVKVPMIADEAVEREKGTGLVMCCTFGDDTDKEWQRKHELPIRALLNLDGRIKYAGHLYDGAEISDENISAVIFLAGKEGKFDQSQVWERNTVDFKQALAVYKAIEGLKPKQANAKIIELLQAAGLLLKQTPMTHTVKCAERSGTPIEIIPTHQWFVRIADKKEALKQKGDQVTWHPEYMHIRLNQWIDGLKEDWCISRQRFFGVSFPVWYSKRAGEEGKILFADGDQLPVDPTVDLPKGYSREEVDGDKDVMDTWATSSISPQINARSLGQGKLFPADMRPQAHEIIRTWAFYTIAKAHLHTDCVPWKNIVISGWCLAADKTKMSKSKGNVVTPVALIEEKGTDAVRYWASTSRLGADTAFSEDLLKIGRKLVNKLWNASQFAALNLDKLAGIPSTATADTKAGHISEPLDLWILSRLHNCVKKATQQFDTFEYCDARVAIEDFFWNDFCDNYLELVKARAYGESGGNQQSALYTIHHCLNALMRLFAPFVPHVTEEIYSYLFDGLGSVHARGAWPKAADYPYDQAAERAGIACVDILNVIRKTKSEAGVSIKYPVSRVEVYTKGDVTFEQLAGITEDLKAAGNAHEIVATDRDELAVATDSGQFAVRVALAKVEDHKRNPDQSEHEKIEHDKILHGPGSPDLSKHVVKVQVQGLAETLQRQK